MNKILFKRTPLKTQKMLIVGKLKIPNMFVVYFRYISYFKYIDVKANICYVEQCLRVDSVANETPPLKGIYQI